MPDTDDIPNANAGAGPDEAIPNDVPDWDDAFFDRVGDRLRCSFDLSKDDCVRDERFDLYGEARIENRKQLIHPSLNYANHEAHKYVFARRSERATVEDLERLVALAHDLADEWVVADEEHFGTEFSFALVVPEIPRSVREFVAAFRDRTLLKFGYYGQYEIHLVAVAPEKTELVASRNAGVARAFRLWDDIPRDESGLLDRLLRTIWR